MPISKLLLLRDCARACQQAPAPDGPPLEPSLFKYAWRHSWREQVLILSLVLVSLPFYWVSFEIPKRIVNDAIQGRAFPAGQTMAQLFDVTFSWPGFLGGGVIAAFPGLSFSQINYLYALSGLFLVLVLVNGWFKYTINIRKGILGERMLRRLRFDLFAQLLRFQPEDIRAVKPAEVAGMIQNEVDPIGGFIGDAFIQPAFLGTQALTAIAFILLQNLVMGLVALGIVLVQAVVIPRLRIEQLRLGRERQLKSRQLAGRIGEMVEGAPTIHNHGLGLYAEADIGGRLGRLFTIRVDLFKRKFSVKYLNNLLAQVTPFFFYAIGGYFALHKQLDIGQLVAVIAAYRDLPPPVKELIDWDQERNDVTIKYEQVVTQFSPPQLLPPLDEARTGEPVDATAVEIVLKQLRIKGGRGNVVVDRASLVLAARSHIAVTGPGASTDALLKALGRQLLDYDGGIEISGRNIRSMPDASFSRLVAYAGTEAQIFPGSIRDNITLSLMVRSPLLANDNNLAAEEVLRRSEAVQTGNPLALAGADWIDYAAAGATGPEGLDKALLKTLKVLGADEEIYRLGIFGQLGTSCDSQLAAAFVTARGKLRQRLERDKLSRLVEPFDPERYHDSSTIAENLLFGVPRGERLAIAALAQDNYVRSILETEGLLLPLAEAGLEIARWTAETFGDMKALPALASRFSLFRSEDMDGFRTIVENVDSRGGLASQSDASLNKLISLALHYVEPQHRLGFLNDALRARMLRARRSFRRFLPAGYQDSIEFYDPAQFNTSAPILDNLLFGRVATGVGNAEKRVAQLGRETLREQGLDTVIFKIGLDRPVGARGSLLSPRLRTIIDLARCIIRQPQILIVNDALNNLSSSEAGQLLDAIRTAMAGRGLVASLPEGATSESFDQIMTLENGAVKLVALLPPARNNQPALAAPAA